MSSKGRIRLHCQGMPRGSTKRNQRHGSLRRALVCWGLCFCRLEPENNAGGRLSRIGCCARPQRGLAEVRTGVNKPTVFQSECEVSGEVVVSTASIHDR